MRPVIGITADYAPSGREGLGEAGQPLHFVKDDLVRAILRAEGLGLLLPSNPEEGLLDEILGLVDGLVFSGSGADIDPVHYGEEPHPALGRRNPMRLVFELQLARRALARDLPILGLCGGLQTLNVAGGGSLYQDIPSQLPGSIQHRSLGPPSAPAHSVTVEKGSLLGRIVGRSSLQVNSTHHQAVKDVAPGFTVCASAPDGVVEALEVPGERFVLAVQWHPEYLAPTCPASQAIFDAFVAACRSYAQAKET